MFKHGKWKYECRVTKTKIIASTVFIFRHWKLTLTGEKSSLKTNFQLDHENQVYFPCSLDISISLIKLEDTKSKEEILAIFNALS